MAIAGELEIRLFAEVARLRADMQKATSVVTSASKQMESAAGLATKALGALGLGISVIGFARMIKGSIDAMDHLRDLSKATNLTVEQLAGLKVAAKQSGGDLDSIAASVLKLSVEMGKAPEKFRALGISAKDPFEAFKQLADIFNRIEDPQQRNAVAAAALGKAWAGAAPLMAEGSQKIQEMVDAGTKASGITTAMANKADELNDKWVLLVGSGGLMNTVVGQMLDPLIRVTDQMIKAKEASSGWLEAIWKFSTTGGGNDVVGKYLGLVKETAPAAAAASGRRAFGHGGGGGAGGGGAGISAQAAKFLDDGAAEREAAKLTAAAIKKAKKEEADSRLEVAALTKSLREQEIEDGFKLQKLHETWSAEEAKIAADKLLVSKEAVDAIRLSLLTEQEMMAEHYNVQLEALAEARKNKAITDAEYNDYAFELEQKHVASITEINDAAFRKRFGIANQYRKLDLDSAGFFFNQMAGMMTSKSREMFEIGKAAAIAGAVIDTYKAATGAYASLASIPIVGPALGAAAAAAAIVAGIANVQAIQSASFGGGMAAPTFAANPSTGLPAAGAGAAQGGGQTTVIHLPGEDFISTKTVRKLIERINESSTDGGRLVIA